LTQGAANLINTFGTEQQKSLFLPPMLEGRWLGTMCLSEPQAGSSLADIRTRAEPIGDGRYKLTGTKMWISGGEQDISENIVNMVLAKVPGGPPGVKGISLFITPKMRVHDDGSLGDPNNITLAGLNHKLGNRATTNTLLNFGEKGECIGWLVGEEHHGLAYMFQMMNEARIAVGHGASMLGLAGYLYSLQYAKERPQGRRPSEKDPESPQIPLIEHADVRRLLLAQKAFTEGAMALIFYCAQLVDEIAIAPSKEEAQRIELLLDLLTPMAKSWPSEYCLEANKHAIQILGGYGYTRDYPVERFYRDNRLNPIHEGAHAIHGIDLLGRKVRVGGGAAFQTFIELVSETLDETQSHTELAAECAQLSVLRDTLIDTTQTLADPGQGERELANATLYLDAFGHITVGWLWLRQGLAALKRQNGGEETPFLSGKLQTMRYFYRYELVKVPPMLDLCKAADDTCLAMTAQQYL
ncbi:MAG: acyl-CoA dehydrogenase, partial [Pseudomonadota bacterium]